jgi:hypothetical protein
MKQKSMYDRVKAQVMAEAGELDVDTTAGSGSGGTEDGSGNIQGGAPPAQAAADAGKGHDLSTDADRGPGELSPGVEAPNAMHQRTESTSVVGLFVGNFVRVVEKDTQKTVDRGIIRKAQRTSIELEGGVSYDQSKYRFIRLA